jgi:hypothetical protein
MTFTLEVDLPADLAWFRLPEAVAARLQSLLDRQDSGQPLTAQEREEAEGLVDLAEFLSLLRLRAERMPPGAKSLPVYMKKTHVVPRLWHQRD